MIHHRRLSWIVFALILATLLAAGGCKQSGAPQAGNQQTNEYGQPAGAPSSMPGLATQPSAPPAYPESAGAEPAPAAPGGAYDAQQPAAGAAPAPVAMEIPAGTRLKVSLNHDLGSKLSAPGQSFSASVTEDVLIDGVTVIKRGSVARGTVIDAKPMGHFKGGARLAIRLQEVNSTAGIRDISTSTVERFLKGKGKRTAGLIGGGAGVGALIGGLTGGGKGAAIGAGVGAGAGTVGAGATGNKQIVMPAGTVVTFKLKHPVRVGG